MQDRAAGRGGFVQPPARRVDGRLLERLRVAGLRPTRQVDHSVDILI